MSETRFEMRGIDISRYQGNIDFDTIKKHGEIQFIILKAGGSDDGLYTDSMFEHYYKEASKCGFHIGCYYFVGRNFVSKEDGIADANRFAQIIKGKKFDMPVYLDLERPVPETRYGNTNASIAFCKRMEELGYYCGIYASDVSGFIDRLEITRLDEFDKWVARYGSSPQRVGAYGMWQFSETGKVYGIAGNVDMDIAYRDYPTIIRQNGLNGYPKPEKKEEPKVENTEPMISKKEYDKLVVENDLLNSELNKIKKAMAEIEAIANKNK